jgi:hypothetical protein
LFVLCLFKQLKLSKKKEKEKLHLTCGSFSPEEKTNIINPLDFVSGIYHVDQPAHLKQGSNSQLLTMTIKQMLLV